MNKRFLILFCVIACTSQMTSYAWRVPFFGKKIVKKSGSKVFKSLGKRSLQYFKNGSTLFGKARNVAAVVGAVCLAKPLYNRFRYTVSAGLSNTREAGFGVGYVSRFFSGIGTLFGKMHRGIDPYARQAYEREFEHERHLQDSGEREDRNRQFFGTLNDNAVRANRQIKLLGREGRDRFCQLDRKLDSVDKRLGKQVKVLDRRFKGIHDGFENIQNRVKDFSEETDKKVAVHTKACAESLEEIDDELSAFKAGVKDRFECQTKIFADNFTKVDGIISKLTQDNEHLAKRLKALELATDQNINLQRIANIEKDLEFAKNARIKISSRLNGQGKKFANFNKSYQENNRNRKDEIADIRGNNEVFQVTSLLLLSEMGKSKK